MDLNSETVKFGFFILGFLFLLRLETTRKSQLAQKIRSNPGAKFIDGVSTEQEITRDPGTGNLVRITHGTVGPIKEKYNHILKTFERPYI